MELQWAKMTAPELRKRATLPNSMAILPAGALEQHGPHLPVITDTASAGAVSLRVAELVANQLPVAVLPSLWLGMSEHHLPLGGTVSVTFDAYRSVLGAIVRSLKVASFDRLLIVNGHGGNVEPLKIITRESSVEHSFPIVVATPWLVAPEETSAVLEADASVTHACEGETSMMMAIHPELVSPAKIPRDSNDELPNSQLSSGIYRFFSAAERSGPSGFRGTPSAATAEKGDSFISLQARELAAAIVNENLWSIPEQVWAHRN